ncbi:hypothetical protein JB92DRAFT_2827875 [Gautieria morchelliformis]|nr:hypothetical protein JB92DRAFT_2827875 [Gautieria morchelliformis]
MAAEAPTRTRILCNCERYCRGGKQVSRSTWFRHARFRVQSYIPEFIPEDYMNGSNQSFNQPLPRGSAPTGDTPAGRVDSDAKIEDDKGDSDGNSGSIPNKESRDCGEQAPEGLAGLDYASERIEDGGQQQSVKAAWEKTMKTMPEDN